MRRENTQIVLFNFTFPLKQKKMGHTQQQQKKTRQYEKQIKRP